MRLPFGGSADVIACRRAERLQAELGGQTAGADNAPGAAGRIAIKALKAATHGNPDVITSSGPVVLFARVFRRPGCDLARDLAPISQLARVQFGIAAGPLCKCKGRSMAEVLTKAKVDPHAASGGASGNGRLQHFLGLLIGDASRVWLPP